MFNKLVQDQIIFFNSYFVEKYKTIGGNRNIVTFQKKKMI